MCASAAGEYNNFSRMQIYELRTATCYRDERRHILSAQIRIYMRRDVNGKGMKDRTFFENVFFILEDTHKGNSV